MVAWEIPVVAVKTVVISRGGTWGSCCTSGRQTFDTEAGRVSAGIYRSARALRRRPCWQTTLGPACETVLPAAKHSGSGISTPQGEVVAHYQPQESGIWVRAIRIRHSPPRPAPPVAQCFTVALRQAGPLFGMVLGKKYTQSTSAGVLADSGPKPSWPSSPTALIDGAHRWVGILAPQKQR